MENSNKQVPAKQTQNLLKTFEAKIKSKRREVIYGIYDNSRASLLTKLDDFFIDHSHVSLEEKAYFFHLLAVMIDAGIPLVQALKMLSNRTKSERFYRVLTTVAFNVISGKKLSEAMARFPDVFAEIELGIIRSGEAAGNLEKMLFRLSDQLDKSHDLQLKLVTASIYPIAVLVVLALVASGMLIWVIPNLVTLLKEGGLKEKDFPLATQFLIGLSFYLGYFWWAIIAGIFVIVLAVRVYISSENGRFKWDLFKLKIPILGSLMRNILVLRFVSTLGILIESGLPVVQALTIIAGSLNNELYRLKVWEVIARVQQGERISASLADAPFLFPETIAQMIAVGEQSAALGSISEKIAAHYDREIDNTLKRLTSLFEPIMIVFVGFTVAVMALAVLTPIFKLTTLV